MLRCSTQASLKRRAKVKVNVELRSWRSNELEDDGDLAAGEEALAHTIAGALQLDEEARRDAHPEGEAIQG